MRIKIFADNESLSEYAATEWAAIIKEKPDAVVCLASGDSPKLTCELFCKKVEKENIDVSKFFFAGLDEWVGVSPSIVGSCHSDFQKRLLQPLTLGADQYHLFDALSNDLKNECAVMDKIIAAKGGIDLMIVGIGMNGHIGFNEPGVDFSLQSHVIDLDETTISVGQKYFTEKVFLKKGITLGLSHLTNAKKVFLLANGERKAAVVKKAVEEPVTNSFPAGIMQQQSGGYILVDKAAASLLSNLS